MMFKLVVLIVNSDLAKQKKGNKSNKKKNLPKPPPQPSTYTVMMEMVDVAVEVDVVIVEAKIKKIRSYYSYLQNCRDFLKYHLTYAPVFRSCKREVKFPVMGSSV